MRPVTGTRKWTGIGCGTCWYLLGAAQHRAMLLAWTCAALVSEVHIQQRVVVADGRETWIWRLTACIATVGFVFAETIGGGFIVALLSFFDPTSLSVLNTISSPASLFPSLIHMRSRTYILVLTNKVTISP